MGPDPLSQTIAAGEEIALARHPSGCVEVEVIPLDALQDLLMHAMSSLGAWCEDHVVLFDADVDALDVMGLGW